MALTVYSSPGRARGPRSNKSFAPGCWSSAWRKRTTWSLPHDHCEGSAPEAFRSSSRADFSVSPEVGCGWQSDCLRTDRVCPPRRLGGENGAPSDRASRLWAPDPDSVRGQLLLNVARALFASKSDRPALCRICCKPDFVESCFGRLRVRVRRPTSEELAERGIVFQRSAPRPVSETRARAGK